MNIPIALISAGDELGLKTRDFFRLPAHYRMEFNDSISKRKTLQAEKHCTDALFKFAGAIHCDDHIQVACTRGNKTSLGIDALFPC